jgi:FkbH-like protein
MESAEFLYPTDLSVTETRINRVLLVGACVGAQFMHFLKPHCPGVELDYVYFNNTLKMPDAAQRPIGEYDFQLISLPLRDVVGDRVIRFTHYNDPVENKSITDHARQALRIMLTESLHLNRLHGVLTFVSNFGAPAASVSSALDRRGGIFDFATLVRQLNSDIVEIIKEHKNVYLFDLDAIGNAVGKRYFLDDALGFYPHAALITPTLLRMLAEHDSHPMWNAPVPGRIEPVPVLEDYYAWREERVFACAWRHMVWLYRAINSIDTVKLVIFDLDDTLWRGQIAEHYETGANWPSLHGWPPGIWEAIHHLKSRGILVAICSKNDEGLVRDRWQRAMQLDWVTLDDFSFVKINWSPKADNIRQIIGDASLTPKSVVFVDDNPVERDAVRSAIPGIRVIGSNPYDTRRVLLWSSETQVPFLSAESRQREEMMRQQQQREQERGALSREEFLAGLNAQVNIDVIESESHPGFGRAFELLNKTNQFNTTGERWTQANVRSFFADRGRLHVFWVEDKFTKYGLVGVICFRGGCFRQFVMSCRVLGLDIETSVVGMVMRHERRLQDTGVFLARVIDTDANMVCRDIYSKCGFSRREDGHFFYEAAEFPKPAAHLTFREASFA